MAYRCTSTQPPYTTAGWRSDPACGREAIGCIRWVPDTSRPYGWQPCCAHHLKRIMALKAYLLPNGKLLSGGRWELDGNAQVVILMEP